MGNWGLTKMNSTQPMEVMHANMNARHNNNDQNGEKDEEKLKKQLLDLDLYEVGMSVKEMRERIEFIDDSKNEASFSSTNNSASPSDVIEAVQSPTVSPADNHIVTNLPAKTISQESTSPDAMIGTYSKQWSSQKDNDSQEDLMCFPKQADTNIGDSVRARKVIDESSNSRYVLSPSPNRDVNITRRNHGSQEMKTYCNTLRISKLLDHFDILDCKTLPNDVPLKPRCPPKQRQKIRVADGMPVIPDDISAQKLAHLTEMANLAHSWKTKLVCKEFSWGPPIKVGIANGSLDKFPIQEDLPDKAEPPEQSCLMTREVNPSSYSLRPTVKSTNMYDFNDSDEDFEIDKRKKAPKISLNRAETPRQPQKKKNLNRGESENTSTTVTSLLGVSENMPEKTNSTLNGRKRAKSASPEYPEDVSTYPRRVVPPIPSNIQKSRKKTPQPVTRTKKRTASPAHTTEGLTIKKSTSGLSDKEIAELISDDEELKIVDCVVPPTKRLNQGMKYLKKAQQAKEEEKKKRENEAKLIAEQEAREQQERIQRRINERDEKRQQQEEREKATKEREHRYRNALPGTKSPAHQSGTFQKRIELESEELRPRMIPLPSESMDVDDADMFPDEEYERIKAVEVTEQPNCPICGESFSQDEIENHAANCDDFVEDEPKDTTHANPIRSSSSQGISLMYRCEICKFATRDEDLYKKHFVECVRSLTEEGSVSTERASTSSNTRILLATHDSDLEIDQTETIPSPSTHGKRKPKPQSRKKKF